MVLTRVFSTTAPLNEADDEQDEDDEGDGTHQTDEPALCGDIDLIDVGWRHRRQSSLAHELRKMSRSQLETFLLDSLINYKTPDHRVLLAAVLNSHH